MRRYLAAALTALAVATTAPAAVAASRPRPVPPACNLVTDPTGDVAFSPSRPPGVGDSEPAMDLTVGDVAATARAVTGVVKVKSAPGQLSPGTAWSVRFTVNNGLFALVAHQDGNTIKYGVYAWQPINLLTTTPRWTRSGNATGSASGTTFTINAPWTSFGSAPAVGTKLLGLHARIERWVVSPDGGTALPLLYPYDYAETAKPPYAVGSPSCVKVA